MDRTRHRVFWNTDPRSEHPRRKIAAVARCGNDHLVIRDFRDERHIRIKSFDLLFAIEQQKDHISLCFPRLLRLRTDGFGNARNGFDLRHRIRGKI